MSDQELDNLFKEASAKYEAPFEEKEWEKMAALLDKPLSPKPGFWNWKMLSGLALLLLITGTVLVTQWDRINGGVKNNGNQTSEEVDHFKDAIAADERTETVQTDNQEQGTNVDHTIEISKEDNANGDDKGNELNSISSQSKSPSSSAPKDLGTDNNAQVNSKELMGDDKIIVANVADNKGAMNSKTLSDVNKSNRKGKQAVNASAGKIAHDKENSTVNSSVKAIQVIATQQVNDEKSVALAAKSERNDEKKKDAFGKEKPGEKQEVKSGEVVVRNTKNRSDNEKLVSPLAGNNSISMINEEAKETSTSLIATNKISEEKNDDNSLNELLSAHTSIKETSQEKMPDSSVVVPPTKKDSVRGIDAIKKEEHNKIDSLTKTHRFSVKLALSPDFSSIGYFKPGKTGFNYGLLAEYNITRHWSITLGGIWSKKSYADTQTENLGYGTVNSTQINGSCRVLDLPLNINYYITPQNAFSLYGSIGVSSYFMFDEDYTYDYVYGTKQYSYSRKINRGNTEWFRMMNLSIGIQQQLSPRVRLQLEPFIKVPMSGIGGGDLKLVSSGVFLNLKYTFN